MLSRHFRAHNLNVPEMRLLFSLRCADPGIFVRGGEGGGPTAEKQPQQHYFKPSTDFTVLQGGWGPAFFRGVQLFPGGIQMLISIKTHITCDFPEGSGPPVPPRDPRM